MILFTAVAFLAGVLTILTPCIFVVLPIILGTAVVRRGKSTPYVVVGSLIISIVLFTVLLKTTTLFVHIDEQIWRYLTGVVLVLFGLTLIRPQFLSWVRLPPRVGRASNRSLGSGIEKKSFWGDVLVGASLGPVFSSCSPTYFLILATIFPLSFGEGLWYVSVYAFGLGLMLFFIALLGGEAVARLRFFSDVEGTFKRLVGGIFIVIGLLVVSGLSERIETKLLDMNFIDVSTLEYRLIKLLP
jgi:cytochrome c-type biogenesis protein